MSNSLHAFKHFIPNHQCESRFPWVSSLQISPLSVCASQSCVDNSLRRETLVAHIQAGPWMGTCSQLPCCSQPPALGCRLFVFLSDRCRGCLMVGWTTLPDTIAVCVFSSELCHGHDTPPQPNHKRPHVTDYLYPIGRNYINSFCCRCFEAFFSFFLSRQPD